MSQQLKCVLVGDSYVGKTSLLTRYFLNKLTEECQSPSDCRAWPYTSMVDGEPVTVSLCDTVGLEDYDRDRLLSYPQTDLFLICFSMVNPTSFENVRTRWLPEIRSYCPEVPIILVGCKWDLCASADNTTIEELRKYHQKPMNYAEGLAMAKEIDATKYMQCSALMQRESLKNIKRQLKLAIIIKNCLSKLRGRNVWSCE